VGDNLGATSGIGSRFFTISNSSSGLTAGLRAAEPSSSAVIDARPAVVGSAASVASIPQNDLMVAVRHGFDNRAPTAMASPDPYGVIRVQTTQLEPIVVDVDPMHAAEGSYRGYTIDDDVLRELPIGSSFDARTSQFAWAPGLAVGGTHKLVFVREAAGKVDRVRIDVTVTAQRPAPGEPRIVIDTPGTGVTNAQPFTVAGWTIDPNGASDGPGVDTLHVWAYPADGGDPLWVGVAAYGGLRPDVAGLFGSRFLRSGFSIDVAGLPAGAYTLAVYAHSASDRGFVVAGTVAVNVVR
jgi:hypothetical protein